jgi:hypothetical protein
LAKGVKREQARMAALILALKELQVRGDIRITVEYLVNFPSKQRNLSTIPLISRGSMGLFRNMASVLFQVAAEKMQFPTHLLFVVFLQKPWSRKFLEQHKPTSEAICETLSMASAAETSRSRIDSSSS